MMSRLVGQRRRVNVENLVQRGVLNERLREFLRAQRLMVTRRLNCGMFLHAVNEGLVFNLTPLSL